MCDEGFPMYTNGETRNIWLIVWGWFRTMHFLSNFAPFPFKDAPSCFPLVWPWRQCNPRAPRLMLFLLFPPVFVFLRSTKRLRLLFMLSSRWPKPCLHCWRCSIISSNVSNKITFFLLDHKITLSDTNYRTHSTSFWHVGLVWPNSQTKFFGLFFVFIMRCFHFLIYLMFSLFWVWCNFRG